MESLRVLIADDHPLFREGLAGTLETVPGIELVAQASNGEQAIAMAEELQPDVVVMDLRMPGVNGIEATRAIVRTSPQIRILVLTMSAEDASIFTAMRAGARGYVLKDADKEDILRAIRAVGHGEAIFSPAIATRVIDFFGNVDRGVPASLFPSLTQREREILALLAEGKNNPAIARALSLSPKTVSNYLSNVFGKLQVADRAQAMLRAREAGLGSQPS